MMAAEPRLQIDNLVAGYAVLDRALWQRFAEAREPSAFLQSWIALQCAYIEGACAGLVIMGDPGSAVFSPVAVWPPETEVTPELSAAAETAIAKRQGTVVGSPHPPGPRALAVPVEVDGRICGVAAVAMSGDGDSAGAALRKIQWGAGWIEALVRRQDLADAAHLRDRAALVIDLLANVLEHSKTAAAETALVTDLAARFNCDLVALGLMRGRNCKVVALSNAADFGRQLSLARDVGDAMDEACDQDAIIVFPMREGWDYHVTRAHESLATNHGSGAIMTLPLRANGETIGALMLQRPARDPFDAEAVELLDGAASVIAPVLHEKRANDRLLIVTIYQRLQRQAVRLLGPRYFGRKLATLSFAALVAFFATATTDYAVTSSAVVEARVQRTLAAPFAGYVAAEFARAGAVVEEGALLASIDDQDLVLERLRWNTSRSQRTTEYDRALAERNRAEAVIIRSQINQAEAQIGLLDEQLARTRIVAPFRGVIIEGDLSQRVGSSIERGETLFVIAPMNAWRVALEVDERDIGDIAEGSRGTLMLGAMPGIPFHYRVEQITPVARQAEGRNFFRVEAALDGDFTRLRPNMAGIAKTHVDERLLIEVWTRRMVDWARMALWRWIP